MRNIDRHWDIVRILNLEQGAEYEFDCKNFGAFRSSFNFKAKKSKDKFSFSKLSDKKYKAWKRLN